MKKNTYDHFIISGLVNVIRYFLLLYFFHELHALWSPSLSNRLRQCHTKHWLLSRKWLPSHPLPPRRGGKRNWSSLCLVVQSGWMYGVLDHDQRCWRLFRCNLTGRSIRWSSDPERDFSSRPRRDLGGEVPAGGAALELELVSTLVSIHQRKYMGNILMYSGHI